MEDDLKVDQGHSQCLLTSMMGHKGHLPHVPQAAQHASSSTGASGVTASEQLLYPGFVQLHTYPRSCCTDLHPSRAVSSVCSHQGGACACSRLPMVHPHKELGLDNMQFATSSFQV